METRLEAEKWCEDGKYWHNLARKLNPNKVEQNLNFDNAIKCYEQAMSIDSNYAEPYECLHMCYLDKGDYEKAMKYKEKAREITRRELLNKK